MLRKHAQFFESLFIISDLFILTAAWILSYFLRFNPHLIHAPVPNVPPLLPYLEFLLPLWVIWALVSRKLRLYHSRRTDYYLKEYFDIATSLTFTLFVLIAVIYLFKRFDFSRLAFIYFWAVSFLGLNGLRFFIRRILRRLRKSGYNRRFGLIVGAGELGQQVLENIELYPELGIQIIGFLTNHKDEVGEKIQDVPIIGVYEEIDKILDKQKVDISFIALPVREYSCFEDLIKKVHGHLSEIKVVPGSYEFMGLRGGMDALGHLPIVSLQSSPLYGWDSVFKRLFDLVLGGFILIAALPVMSVIGLLIKLTSEGPIFYRQERIGMDGRPFRMLKFRTMRMDAEKETGPVWAEKDDPRRTKVGALLRKASLDELPQLFNVLRGEMSLVGPRPERPDFVEGFRDQISMYMLRHRVKAGMTGWAQVNGWRGNTSLEKRVECDLYYIQNWSIGFDFRILFMTFWKGFFNKSAY
jgi:Undecaprenyl-phosphate glucose phosphotransferase